jgi:hypothetical protein
MSRPGSTQPVTEKMPIFHSLQPIQNGLEPSVDKGC